MSDNPQNQAPDQVPEFLKKLKPEELEAASKFFLQGISCQRCGWDYAQLRVHSQEEDKKNYLRSVLGEEPFRKLYPLFDGQLKVECVSLDGAQSRQLALLLRDAQSPNAYNVLVDSLQIRMLFYIRRVNADEYAPPPATANYADVQKLFLERFGRKSENLLGTLSRLMMEFTRLIDILSSEGLDNAFWKSAGLC